MKYAKEVIDLLAAYPNRRFKMRHILNHVSKGRECLPAQRHAARVGVLRVLHQLNAAGMVVQHKEGATSATYQWCGTDT